MSAITRRTKIIATLGPASSNQNTIGNLIKAGVDVFRLNLSHNSASEFEEVIRWIRLAEKQQQQTTGILVDLQGPKIRTGPLAGAPLSVKSGSQWLMSPGKTDTEAGRLSISYRELLKDAHPGQTILIDDAKLRFMIRDVKKDHLVTEALVDGALGGNKGVHFPEMTLSASSLTEKDFQDLNQAVHLDIDFVALSFVRRPQDVRYLKSFLEERKCSAHVIAKIEREEATTHIDSIIQESDGIMVARGDMAVEMGPERVPYFQKLIIQKCNQEAKPVITATEMLLSMVDRPTPTRAEASDVANAVLDGSDALMLSNETAVGKFPVDSVRMMDTIIRQTEASRTPKKHPDDNPTFVDETVVRAAAQCAVSVDAKAILIVSQSGKSPRLFGKYRPNVPLFAFLPSQQQCRKMKLIWGVQGLFLENYPSSLDFFDRLLNEARTRGIAAKGDRVVITAGLPDILKTPTNMLQVIELKS